MSACGSHAQRLLARVNSRMALARSASSVAAMGKIRHGLGAPSKTRAMSNATFRAGRHAPAASKHALREAPPSSEKNCIEGLINAFYTSGELTATRLQPATDAIDAQLALFENGPNANTPMPPYCVRSMKSYVMAVACTGLGKNYDTATLTVVKRIVQYFAKRRILDVNTARGSLRIFAFAWRGDYAWNVYELMEAVGLKMDARCWTYLAIASDNARDVSGAVRILEMNVSSPIELSEETTAWNKHTCKVVLQTLETHGNTDELDVVAWIVHNMEARKVAMIDRSARSALRVIRRFLVHSTKYITQSRKFIEDEDDVMNLDAEEGRRKFAQKLSRTIFDLLWRTSWEDASAENRTLVINALANIQRVCGTYDDVLDIFNKAIKIGITPGPTLYKDLVCSALALQTEAGIAAAWSWIERCSKNTLLNDTNFYQICIGFLQQSAAHGNYENAQKIVKHLQARGIPLKREVVTSMPEAMSKAGASAEEIEECWRHFADLVGSQLPLSGITIPILAWISSGNVAKAQELLFTQVHQAELQGRTSLVTTARWHVPVVHEWLKRGNVEEAWRVYCHWRDRYTHDSNRHDELDEIHSDRWVKHMMLYSDVPQAESNQYISMMSTFCFSKHSGMAEKVLEDMIERGVASHPYAYRRLASVYASDRNIDRLRDLQNRISLDPTIRQNTFGARSTMHGQFAPNFRSVNYGLALSNTLLTAWAMMGKDGTQEALQHFDMRRFSSVGVDTFTLVNYFDACGHAGRLHRAVGLWLELLHVHGQSDAAKSAADDSRTHSSADTDILPLPLPRPNIKIVETYIECISRLGYPELAVKAMCQDASLLKIDPRQRTVETLGWFMRKAQRQDLLANVEVWLSREWKEQPNAKEWLYTWFPGNARIGGEGM